MTRDSRFPGPAFPERAGSPAPDSPEGRRTGLWASLKRAFGSDPSDGADESIPFLAEDPAPFELPQGPVQQAPAIPPPAVPGPPPVSVAAASGSGQEASRSPEPPSMPPDISVPPEAPPAAVQAEKPPVEAGAATSDAADTKPTRLARGLASFSRSNSEREKKFAHILRDKPSSKEKSPPRRRG